VEAMLTHGKRLVVFSVRKSDRTNAVIWTRAGNASVNKDGSLNVWLDVLPQAGATLHVREAHEKKEIREQEIGPALPESLDAAMGVHQ
jgi:hypothetical protein